jgi:FHA domain
VGLLKHVASERQFLLRARSWVGRHADADIDLSGPGASIEHATIYWSGSDWWIHDRASRNGTKLNDKALIRGRHERLTQRDLLVFGDPGERWRVVDLSPPKASARELGSNAWIAAHMDALYLPNPESPAVGIFHRNDSWILEDETGIREASDGEVIALGTSRYRLWLPPPEVELARTQMLSERPSFSQATARFDVSSDEETVKITLMQSSSTLPLPEWAYNYVLLTLARAVLKDQADGVPVEDVGWLYCDDLARSLNITMTKLNIDVHRARRSMEAMDYFYDPSMIVERRRTTGQIRLGTLHVVINDHDARTKAH